MLIKLIIELVIGAVCGYVANMIMNGNQDAIGDVNEDGEVTVADVDAVVNRILSK